MADRGYVHRLRTTGGPSHDLLVLLDQHRVMTTDQLARSTGTPERSVRYRLERLHSHGLVDRARPGRERGSLPNHWWLRPSGARLVAGTAAAEGRPSGMFVAHAAAITEVWLSFVEHGPAHGIHVEQWLTDRAGWQEWERTDRWSTHPLRLTPDAVATLGLADGSEAVVFVEVDLASMTQTVLKQKVARYLAYADALVWQDQYPYCPPMLLLTTTTTRAVSFTKVAGQAIDGHRRRFDTPTTAPRDSSPPRAGRCATRPARSPSRAGRCPTPPSPTTLTEILEERACAREASEAWLYDRDVVQRRRADIEALREITRFHALGDLLDSPAGGEVLPVLVGDDPEEFLDNEPDLAQQIIDWVNQRRRLSPFRARDLAKPFVSALEPRRDAVWRQQAQRLLAATGDIADRHPRICRLAATLASGRLVTAAAIAVLDHPAEQSRAEIQQAILGDYHARRAAAVEQQWAGLGWRDRRRVTRVQIEADYDERHLCVCDTYALIYPLPPEGETISSRCRHCDGTILDWPDRTSITTLAKRLDTIQAAERD